LASLKRMLEQYSYLMSYTEKQFCGVITAGKYEVAKQTLKKRKRLLKTFLCPLS